MYAGQVEEVGVIRSIRTHSITISCHSVQEHLSLGDSICVNGVSLPVINIAKAMIVVDVREKIFQSTNFGNAVIFDEMNLEREKPGGGIGDGSISGRVDGVTEVKSVRTSGATTLLTLNLPDSFRPFVMERGTITLDGVKVMVEQVKEHEFSIALSQKGVGHTSLVRRKAWDRINIEVEQIAKYIQHQLALMLKSGANFQPEDFLLNTEVV